MVEAVPLELLFAPIVIQTAVFPLQVKLRFLHLFQFHLDLGPFRFLLADGSLGLDDLIPRQSLYQDHDYGNHNDNTVLHGQDP